MGIKDQYRWDELTNIAEDLVIEELERQLVEAGLLARQDEDSLLDMAAYALNLIKPLYRANLLGRVYAQAFHDEYHAEIADAVKKAIEKINSNPPR